MSKGEFLLCVEPDRSGTQEQGGVYLVEDGYFSQYTECRGVYQAHPHTIILKRERAVDISDLVEKEESEWATQLKQRY